MRSLVDTVRQTACFALQGKGTETETMELPFLLILTVIGASARYIDPTGK